MCSDSANHDKKEVVALRAFFSRPWFKRVWVLQEARNGPHPQVICGTENFSWRHIADLTGYGFPSTTLGVEPVVLRMQNAKHYGIGLPVVGDPLTPENLFEMLVRARPCLSTDPRDKAFALLSLFDAVGPSKSTQGFVADYSISTSETFVRLASYLLQSAKVGTQLLSAIEPGSTLDGLPSWVPDWSLRPAEPSLALRDCFETGINSIIHWSASFTCYSPKLLSATTLQVTGMHVDYVTKIIQCYHQQRWVNMVVGDRKQDTCQTAKGLKRNYYELLWPYNWYDKSDRLRQNAQRTGAGLPDDVPLYVGAAVDYWDRSDARKDLRNVQLAFTVLKIV
ncbi:HET-domain-containing protein [Fusarium austroafricanum]|uniref:HET-domain-containing protein n=1 Tax=Fusarium austroafricanum TaxID=2364996 RepID=A0A8H4JY06_9HYPO|nr:HET-domain-containing protein [Fusarium austroafricanum]